MAYVFTKKQFAQLEKKILRTQRELDKILKKKGEVAGSSAGDGWHSPEFMATYVEEVELRKKLSDLRNLASGAKIIKPKEQNERVAIGNEVIIKHEDGSQEKIILEGFITTPKENLVSIYSPLGKVLKGAKKGQTKVVEIEGRKKKIKILEILSPLETKN